MDYYFIINKNIFIYYFMDIISKYKIIRKIKSGGQGTVYLVKYKNKKYILKIEKILKKNINKNYKSIYWREIDFAKNINKINYNHFIKLYDYNIVNNYNFKLENPYNISYIDELNKSNYCSLKIYEYVDMTLDKIIDKLNITELYSIIIQLSYSIYLMNKNGYTHNDLHINNIGIKKTKKTSIYIFNYKIPTFGNIVKIIDYGNILHKKYTFIKNPLYGDISEKKIYNENKILEIKRILDIVYDIPFYNSIPIKVLEKIDFMKDIDDFLKSKYYILVDDLVYTKEDKYLLFSLVYPNIFQKRLLKSKYKKCINNILRLPIYDIIYLLNATNINTYKDIKNIILYFTLKIDKL
jgi:serine/threonine protein kinase